MSQSVAEKRYCVPVSKKFQHRVWHWYLILLGEISLFCVRFDNKFILEINFIFFNWFCECISNGPATHTFLGTLLCVKVLYFSEKE